MSFTQIDELFAGARVIPVLTPTSVTDGVTVSRILFEAGLAVQEITLRTSHGCDTIAALRRELPDLVVGAGSVLSADLGEAALQAGACFLVSPGITDPLLRFAADCAVPFLPGVATVTEMMHVLAIGCRVAKLFPAESLGGVAFLRSVAGPLAAMKFCPTGGIDADLARSYLKLSNVLAVGGSWMAPPETFAERDHTNLRRLAELTALIR